MLFLAGLALFFVPHFYTSFRSRAEGQDIRRKWGEAKYMGLYSLVSLAGFVLIIIGFGATRPSPVLFEAPLWGQHLNLILSSLALILIIASQFPAGHIKQKLKHPMLVGIKLWALGHLLSNGELNSVILFGLFLAYAVIDRIAVKRRGDFGPVGVKADAKFDILSLVIGGAVVLAFIVFVHPKWIGVPVM